MINLQPAIAEIDQQINQLRAAREVLVSLNGDAPKEKRERPKMSASARARIAAAQRARWAKWKARKK